MYRRQFLGLSAAGSVTVLAGCQGNDGDDEEVATNGSDDGVRPPPGPSSGDLDLPVPSSELDYRLPRDRIPAIVEPTFAADWSGVSTDDPDVDPTLPDCAPIVGVTRTGRARAYPLRILDWHEIVNDRFGGPIGVSYCVLCGSAVVFERSIVGPTVFGVSGALWRDDLVMYDSATESLWSQLLATAIRGDRTGEQLPLLTASLTTWGEWRERHPGTEVLLPPPHSNTVKGREETYDYFQPKYSYGDEEQLVGFDSESGALKRRTLVVGVSDGDAVRAYPFPVVEAEGVVNDEVGELPVVVTVTPDGALGAYDRRVDGKRLTFSAADVQTLAAAGSVWQRTTGRALDGPHEGKRLDRANEHTPMFWQGWSNFNPETEVYGLDSTR